MKSASAEIFEEASTTYDNPKLGQVCKTTSGGTPDRKRVDYYGGNVAWIKSGELKDNLIDCSEEYITEEGLSNSSAKIFPRGTLLVAMYGANVGMTGVLDIDAATNQAVCAIFPSDSLEKNYVWWFFRYMRSEFMKRSFGGAQPNISQKILRETTISIPPLGEQRRILAYLDDLQAKVNALKSLQEKTTNELDALLPSILDKAFKGEL